MINLELSDGLSILAVVISAWAVWYTRKSERHAKRSVDLAQLQQAPRLEVLHIKGKGRSEVIFNIRNIGGYGMINKLINTGDFEMRLPHDNIVLREETSFPIFCEADKIDLYLRDINNPRISCRLYYYDELTREYFQDLWLEGVAPKIGPRKIVV